MCKWQMHQKERRDHLLEGTKHYKILGWGKYEELGAFTPSQAYMLKGILLGGASLLVTTICYLNINSQVAGRSSRK